MKPDLYKKIAASGRYHNTGKVLLGLQYIPRQRIKMSRDDEIIQSVLLGQRVPSFRYDLTVYVLYAIGVGTLIWAIAEALK